MLDLQPLVQQLADRIGLTEEQVEERLGPDAGRIVIMESDQLGTVQTAVELIRKLSVFLAIAILVLFALAVYLAEGRRRETLRNVGITFVIVGALLLVIRRLAGNWIVDTLASGESDTGLGVERMAHRHRPARRHRLDRDRLRRDRHPRRRARRAVALGRVGAATARAEPPRPPGARLCDRGRDVPARRRLGPDAGVPAAVVDLIFAALIGLGIEAFRRLTVPEAPAGNAAASPRPPGDGRQVRAIRCSVRSLAAGSSRTSQRRRSSSPWCAGFVMTLVDEKDFPNFGLAVWWAIVTLATVGYGDVVPTTVAGVSSAAS